MTVIPTIPVLGSMGACLDLKLVNKCNGACPFCIESGGYAPKDVQDPDKLAERINALKIDNLLILGGEPLMYEDIVGLVSKIRKGISIFITTNGSLLTPELAKKLSPHVKSMNISIHHSTSAKHKELTKVSLVGDVLYKSIEAFGRDKVRINCNLVKGYVDSKKEVEAMYEMVKRLGVTKIRFAELQKYPDLFVDAKKLFDGVPADPFKDGCEIKIPQKGLDVTLRITCGIIDKKKKAVVNPTGRNAQTQVMYSNGEVSDGWRTQGAVGLTGVQRIAPDTSCHVHNPRPRRQSSSAGCSRSGGGCS